MKTSVAHPPRTGLAIHASTVAFTSSRAMTSHMRRRYRERYHGRYRFAKLIFAFDLGLVALALGLAAVNLAIFSRPVSPPSHLELSLRSKDLVAGDVIPVEAIVHVTDEKSHSFVRVSWLLPPWVEVLRAEPDLGDGKTAVLGTVTPAKDVRSRLFIRIRALPGTAVPFSFRIQEGEGSNGQVVTGSESRRVSSSAILAEPAIPVDAVSPGGTIPILVENRGQLEAPAVIVHLLTKDGAPQSTLGENGEVRVGTLAPGERRVIFLEVDPAASGKAEFSWDTQDASRQLSVSHLNIPIVAPPAITVTNVESPSGAQEATMSYRADQPGRVLVIHPAVVSPDRPLSLFSIETGAGTAHVPLDPTHRTSEPTWSVIPFEERNGTMVLGARVVGALASSLPFSVAARYYTTSGDQIGVGALPPRVGETTSYWIVWSVGPTEAPLRDMVLSGRLGPGVQATGRYASPVDGSFTATDANVRWTVPRLAPTGGTPATFAFEIAYTPTVADRGSVPILIGQSSARAVEGHTSSTLSSVSPAQDADLAEDAQAKGMGKVE